MQAKATGIGLLIATPIIVVMTLLAQPLIDKAGAEAATCPANTTEGAYFQRGTDENGNALCGFAFYDACPYTEAVSASDPQCTKAQPATVETPAAPDVPAIADAPSTVSTCGGK